MRRQRIKLGRTQSKFAFFIGILFVLFGLSMFIGSANLARSPIGILFPLIWTTIAGFNTYMFYKNGFTDEGLAMYEIETTGSNNIEEVSFDEKLRKLEKLKRDELITESEFNKKRKEIMNEKW